MKFGIVGAGGIGGYLAAKLVAAGQDVSVLARGSQLAAIRAGGLRLVDPDGDLAVELPHASDDPSVLNIPDVIVTAVKSHQLPAAIEQIRAHVGPETRVMATQNGVDAPDMLAEAFGADRTLMAPVRIFANITAPGVITRYGAPKAFTIGTLAGDQKSGRVPEVLSVFRAAGIDAPAHTDVRVELWTKFIIFNAMSSVTTATRLRFGELRKHKETQTLVRRLMQETFDVGRASGVPLADGLVDQTFQLFLNVVPDEGRTSMAQDLEEGRALEIDYVCGAVTRRGRALGVDVTASETIFGLLAPYRNGAPAA